MTKKMMATTQSPCPRGLLPQDGGLIPQFCTLVAYARVHICTRVNHLLHTPSSVSLIREETSKSIRPTVIRGSSPSTNAVELQSASNFWPSITPRHYCSRKWTIGLRQLLNHRRLCFKTLTPCLSVWRCRVPAPGGSGWSGERTSSSHWLFPG